MKETLQFMESAEMRKYLEQTASQVRFSQWCNLIAKSRAGLADKISALREVAEKYPPDEICNPSAMADDAERALELTKSSDLTTVFLLNSYARKNQNQPPELLGDFELCWSEVYHTFEQAIQSISEEYGCVDEKPIDDFAWNEITRYDLSPEGKLEETITYVVSVKGITWGYEWSESISKKQKRTVTGAFSLYDELYLHTPFRLGDVITVDCRPFDGIYHVELFSRRSPYYFLISAA